MKWFSGLSFRLLLLQLVFISAIPFAYSQHSVPAVIVIADQNIFSDPPFKQCHSSSIAQVSDGSLLCTWFAGPYESSKLVTIYTSSFRNGTWSKPRQVADGTENDTIRYACWNPVLAVTPARTVFLYYKVGPSPREWWGMMKWSYNHGKTWSQAQRLPEGFLGPIKNKPFLRSDGTMLHPSSTESLDEKTWQIHIERSDSASENWFRIPIRNDTFGVIQPAILQYPNNRLQMLSRSRQNVIVQTWSDDNGETWSTLTKTHLLNPNSGIDAVTLNNGYQLLVYNPAIKGKDWSDGRNELRVAVSKDGNNWQDVHTLVKEAKGEFSYPAVIQDKDNLIHITYTHNRTNIRHVILRMAD